MKQKRIYLVSILLIIIYFMCIMKYKKTIYTLEVPNLDSVISLEISSITEDKIIKDSIVLNEILHILKSIDTKTKIESNRNTAIYEKNSLKMTFLLRSNIFITFFLYQKKENYYLEQPFLGIYPISRRTYVEIECFLKNKN